MIFDQIKQILGDGGFIAEEADKTPYLQAWRGGFTGETPFVALPQTVKQLAEIVKIAAHARLALVPQGGNTGLVGGATPSPDGDELLINLSRMNEIRNIDPYNYTLTAEAGCTLQSLQEKAADHQLLFPLSMASEGSAQVGGFVSTNAGGTAVLRYGNTRQLVLGIEAVLPNGEVLHDLHSLRKDNTGYDTKQLFIAGEGTLGIITAVTFSLSPALKQEHTAFLAINTIEDAVRLLSLFRELTGDMLTAFELISDSALSLVLEHISDARHPLQSTSPYYILVSAGMTRTGDELQRWFDEALEIAFQKELIRDGAVAASDAHAQDFWRLRESISEAELKAGRGVHFDISVPITKISDFVRVADQRVKSIAPESTIVNFGHLGDGNLHYNVSLPKTLSEGEYNMLKSKLRDAIYKDVREHSGSISAEHGIGQLRKNDLYAYKSHVEYELMQKIKGAIDPHNLMNPGKML